MHDLPSTIERIKNNSDPVSIFLYGSRARGDFRESSDYEIGVLYARSKYISRTQLKGLADNNMFRIYPFVYEDFQQYVIDTPFQKSLYMNELIRCGKTLIGERIIEHLPPPSITVFDLAQDLRFNLGRAFAAIFPLRRGDATTSSEDFYKSCLFGLRDLVILNNKRFPFTYEDIYKDAVALDLGDYRETADQAIAVRRGKEAVEEKYLYKNISLLNSLVEPQIEGTFNTVGDAVLL